jgi:hypothetical protein
MADSEPTKTKFMLELLKSDKLNEKQKAKFLELSIQELERMDSGTELAKKAWAEIKKLKEEILNTKINSSITDGIGIKLRDTQLNDNKIIYRPHNPLKTNEFLSLFKRPKLGFKELMHPPDDDFSLQMYLSKVKKHDVLASEFNQDQVNTNFSDYINYILREDVIKFVKYISNIRLEKYDEIGKHPIELDADYRNKVNEFKRNYRIGTGKTYTNLKEFVITYLDEKREDYSSRKKNIKYFFKTDRVGSSFKNEAHFLTYWPSLKQGLQLIMRDCLEWSNSNDDCIELEFSCTTHHKERLTVLKITDIGSVLKKPTQNLKEDMLNNKAYQIFFRSLCDWEIRFKHNGEGLSMQMLVKSRKTQEPVLENYEDQIQGFTHILKFYHA